MSFQAMAWAVNQKTTALSKLVLLMLANHTNTHSGRCDPSISLLADECGMSRDSVIRQIKALEVAGFLQVIRRQYGAISLRNSYLLLMPGVKINPNFELAEIDIEVSQGGGTDGGGSSCERLEPRSKQEDKPVLPPDESGGLSAKGKSDSKTVSAKDMRERYPMLSEQLTNDYLILRKAKKAPLTKGAWKAICGTLDVLATEHGISPEKTLTIALVRGWQGLKVQWVLNDLQADGGQGNGYDQRQTGNGTNGNHRGPRSAVERVDDAIAKELALGAAARSPEDSGPMVNAGKTLRQ